jgi:hypothetical protein
LSILRLLIYLYRIALSHYIVDICSPELSLHYCCFRQSVRARRKRGTHTYDAHIRIMVSTKFKEVIAVTPPTRTPFFLFRFFFLYFLEC